MTTTDTLTQVMFETGCRVSEMIALGPHSLEGNRLHIKGLKGSHDRSVQISENLRIKLSRLVNKNRYISNCTESVNRDSQRRYITRYLKSLGKSILEANLSPHMLRHTAMTRLYVATKDIVLVNKWAGHKSLNSTLTYMNQETRDRADKVTMSLLNG